jgi:hypothetical protein
MVKRCRLLKKRITQREKRCKGAKLISLFLRDFS